MAQYLYSVTQHETLNDSECAMLIILGLMLKRFDIAWDLIQRRPELVIAKDFYGRTPLNELAGISSAFLSGSSLNFWEQWIYDGIQIKPMRTIEEPIPTTDDDVCIDVEIPEDGDQSNKRQRHLICSGTSLFRGLVVKTFGKLLGFNRIYRMKLAHVRILEFLPRMCEVTKNKDVKELQGLKTAMFLAIKKGHVEYITHLCRANYKLLYITNEKGRNIFQYAAECRQHKVFSLLYGLGDQRNWEWFVSSKDESSNNMLHVVGTISSAAQINLIRGAALQMQRELQWFKEVERFALPVDHELINKMDEMTPRELVTKGHKHLVKEGERAMKDTATSCTVVGALIVTIMFAAAFTIPGGNKQDTGLPIFLSKRAFIIFIVSDVISLFSSTTSVMIFLGILTSRYAEHDFLKSLPTKMILGLITLFLSIVAMMTAFSSALSIMLHGKSSIAILLTLLASVPVASFIWMQFRLLLELVISTYGAGVFDRKIKNWPFEDPKYSASC
ncbi:ankyrin repeat-containing protein ITN1-like [Pyrus x bretschneideri]|uniref:ankyrin repeat-containing protein ITN1-like n=1 Tax=Pyrus x bretschneideri TaxID=225117 RepID=UPI00202F67FE|nr:ankyrin repeat-containing protein ITN1-like [Pyrus x bretschneideri]